MKKVTYLGLALGLVAVTATASFASTLLSSQKNTGKAGIVASSHDLSGGSIDGGDVQKRICVFCHHPHNAVKASATVEYSPLWNRGVPTGFGAYNNSFTGNGATSMMGNGSSAMHLMNGTPRFAGVSLLCMSCHDGTTAMNAYSDLNDLGATGIANVERDAAALGKGKLTGSAALAHDTKDMSNHHPVGMLWADSVKDAEIAPSNLEFYSVAPSAAAPAGTRGSGITIASVLSQGRMECVTCHDVHNSANEAGAERFLWVSDDNSKFCLSCHLK